MRDKPIEQISVKEVVTNLGISRAAFYLYHDSTYAVLQEVEDEFFAEQERAYSAYLNCPLSDIYFTYPHPALLRSMRIIHENSDIYQSLMGPFGDELFRHKTDRIFLKFVIQRAENDGYITVEERFRGLVESYSLGAQRTVLCYLSRPDSSCTDEECAVLLYRLVFAPFRIESKGA